LLFSLWTGLLGTNFVIVGSAGVFEKITFSCSDTSDDCIFTWIIYTFGFIPYTLLSSLSKVTLISIWYFRTWRISNFTSLFIIIYSTSTKERLTHLITNITVWSIFTTGINTFIYNPFTICICPYLTLFLKSVKYTIFDINASCFCIRKSTIFFVFLTIIMCCNSDRTIFTNIIKTFIILPYTLSSLRWISNTSTFPCLFSTSQTTSNTSTLFSCCTITYLSSTFFISIKCFWQLFTLSCYGLTLFSVFIPKTIVRFIIYDTSYWCPIISTLSYSNTLFSIWCT